jgi:hypothetical protein
MKKIILILGLVSSILAEEIAEEEPTGIAGKQPGYATRDATVLSVLGWGVAIAVGIAVFTGLVKNHPAPTTPTPTP